MFDLLRDVLGLAKLVIAIGLIFGGAAALREFARQAKNLQLPDRATLESYLQEQMNQQGGISPDAQNHHVTLPLWIEPPQEDSTQPSFDGIERNPNYDPAAN